MVKIKTNVYNHAGEEEEEEVDDDDDEEEEDDVYGDANQ